jgi:hypothetical protein
VCFNPPEVITAEAVANQLSQMGARNWQVEQVAERIAKALNEPPSVIIEDSETEEQS